MIITSYDGALSRVATPHATRKSALSLFRTTNRKRHPDGWRKGYSHCEDTHSLRLASELADLWSGYAHSDNVGILPDEQMIRSDNI